MIAQPVRRSTEPRSTEAVAVWHGVAKSYEGIVALDGLDLELRRGELLALLGPNGAGKSTAVSLMLGIRKPDRGSVRILGRDPREIDVRRSIGLAPQNLGFPAMLTVAETLDLVRRHYPQPLSLKDQIERFGLSGLEGRQTHALSGGQRKVLGLALAFAGNPEIVFLDEPTAGLDAATRRILWGILASFVVRGGTVLLTTHYIEEAEALATRVALLMAGRIAREGSVSKIARGAGVARIAYTSDDAPPELPGVVRIERHRRSIVLYTENADETVRALARSSAPFRDLEVAPASLEEAYLTLTAGAAS